MKVQPLRLLADFSYLMTLLCGFTLWTGLSLTYSYPTDTIIKNSIFFAVYAIVMTWTYFKNNQNYHWAFKALALMLAIVFIGMVIKGNDIDVAAHSSPVMSDQLFLFLQSAYFGTIVFAAMCLNAINFRSNIHLDKSTIPWTVNLSGLMMYIIGLSYCTRFSILYYYDVPLYKNSRFVIIFVLTTIGILTVQYFGKYGPLYRSHDGNKAFTTISGYLFAASWFHILMPLPQFIANYYQYTPEQIQLTHWVSRTAASLEVIACTFIILCMQHRLSKKYYRQFRSY